MFELSNRNVTTYDLEIICTFPQSPEELFYLGPKFTYPLTTDQIQLNLKSRYSSTVIVKDNDIPIAFANLFDVNYEEQTCYLENVIVSNSGRGHGVSTYLLITMINKAIDEHNLKKLKLFCHNTNTRALLFYSKNGFTPCGSKITENHEGKKIVAIEMVKEIDTMG
ncbi:GNAT family N-acetyltransferase [Paenibacillus sp. GSMTC-2017]|uniref:GNAT family N-acetyltransferase n=1 Tax=Paenibacillus sp. GSMTC-2017 TaxID=2794350 RepID=UPI0018D91578|nr:GNAT family N-acetyltransferase [Paenibacillus sp. GSMTC-2017]MBH5317671.1 GNAT family N-acetyltransferase [Paenibacillus sp. GSMTC-2017]